MYGAGSVRQSAHPRARNDYLPQPNSPPLPSPSDLLQADSLPLSAGDCCLAVVPMFHANSWGLVYAAPMVGARLVLPGKGPEGCGGV